MGECNQWKANGQCSAGNSLQFTPYPASGNRCEGHRSNGQPSSPAPNSKAQSGGQINVQIEDGQALVEQE